MADSLAHDVLSELRERDVITVPREQAMSIQIEERLREAYRAMNERVHRLLEQAGHSLDEAIDKAREQAYALGELTREEAEEVASALKRDVEAVALAMMAAEAGLREWVDTDLAVAEYRLLERALASADPTTLEWLWLKERLREQEAAPVHAGDEAAKGAYLCLTCGEVLHLEHAARVPPCPHCRGARFKPIRSVVM